jgi:hypothetical protein
MSICPSVRPHFICKITHAISLNYVWHFVPTLKSWDNLIFAMPVPSKNGPKM